jgi:hypothetical protein
MVTSFSGYRHVCPRAGVIDFDFVQDLTAAQRLGHEDLRQLLEVKERHTPAQYQSAIRLLTMQVPKRGVRRSSQRFFRAKGGRTRRPAGAIFRELGYGLHGDDPFGYSGPLTWATGGPDDDKSLPCAGYVSAGYVPNWRGCCIARLEPGAVPESRKFTTALRLSKAARSANREIRRRIRTPVSHWARGSVGPSIAIPHRDTRVKHCSAVALCGCEEATCA